MRELMRSMLSLPWMMPRLMLETGERLQRGMLDQILGAAPAPEADAGAPAGTAGLFGSPHAASPVFIDATPVREAELRALPDQGPVVMLNLYRFKPDGGAERFAEYLQKGLPIFGQIGAKVLYTGEVRFTVIGPEKWDQCAIVEYPSLEVYRQFFLDNPDFRALLPLRASALADSRLYVTQTLPAPAA